MRAIHKVRLDKVRPALLLTREYALGSLNNITVAPITSTIRGLSVEVPVGPDQGLDHDSVINCDDITTVPAEDVGELIGYLSRTSEGALHAAIVAAFALRPLPH